MSFHTLHVSASKPGGDPPDLSVLAAAMDEVEVRVTASLMEKEVATPDNYPLSLNALVTACNQKTSRDPVVEYDEVTVRQALDRLRERGLVRIVTGGDNRVPKYRQTLTQALRLTSAQNAVLAVMMLRGPQTLGELRERCQRMHEFAGLDEAQQAIDSLMDFGGKPMAVKLERLPGTKEPRYAHLLAGEPILPAAGSETGPGRSKQTLEERLVAIETELAELRSEVARLNQKWTELER